MSYELAFNLFLSSSFSCFSWAITDKDCLSSTGTLFFWKGDLLFREWLLTLRSISLLKLKFWYRPGRLNSSSSLRRYISYSSAESFCCPLTEELFALMSGGGIEGGAIDWGIMLRWLLLLVSWITDSATMTGGPVTWVSNKTGGGFDWNWLLILVTPAITIGGGGQFGLSSLPPYDR